MSKHTTSIQVRYAETDQMGVAYHANYLVWMEVARTDLCRSLGLQYREMEAEDGILLAVTEAHCRYLSAARYDDDVAITATLGEANRRFISFEYEMKCAERRVASGVTKHIFLNREFRPVRLPDKFAGLFGVV